MAENCFLFFNNQINVDVIKIDTNLSQNFEQSVANKDQMFSTTVLFNTFDSTIDASYFAPDNSVSGSSIAIYKKTPFQKYYDFITLLTDGYYEFYDYNIVNNEYYHYLASVEIQTSSDPEYKVYQNLNPDNSLVYIQMNWDRWSLVNIIEQEDGSYLTEGRIWTFRANIDSEEITQNTNVVTWDTLGRYPKMSIGQKNYGSSTFTALLGDIEEYTVFSDNSIIPNNIKYGYTEKINVNSQYATNMEKLTAWKEFVTDGEVKLLRDLKGNAWIVQVQANPTNSIDLKNNLQAVTISFQWQEVADIEGASIISLGG